MTTMNRTRICPKCSRPLREGKRVCLYCNPRSPGKKSAVDAARSRDLKMEAHIRAIAIWYRVFGVVYGGCFLLAFFITLAKGVGIQTQGVLGLGVVVCVLSYLVGHFLKRYSDPARIISGILAIVAGGSLFIQAMAAGGEGSIFTAGLIIYYGFVCWALFSRRARKICSGKYRKVSERTAYVVPKTFHSPFFWAPMIPILLTLIALFALLYVFSALAS